MEKLVWVLIILLSKIFIPSYVFDALLCRNWSFLPPNHEMLQLTLITMKEQDNFPLFLV